MSAQDEDDRNASPFPKPLNFAQITDAVRRSSDAGATIILSKLRISDIGALEAEELANAGKYFRQETGSTVERLALASNRLYQLPQEFALFTSLRYINLKHNTFAVFPDVLTKMPSLDTLDISYNKIHNLPPHPGNLVQLKVLCLSRNKITRLPSYMAQLRDLEVLQVDRNPIEWSPETNPPANLEDPVSMKNWIRSLQSLLESERGKTSEYDDSGYAERLEWENVLKSPPNSWRFPPRIDSFEAVPTPHARSFSIDSNVSGVSVAESLPSKRVNGQIPSSTEAIDYSRKHADRYMGIMQEDLSSSPPISTKQDEEVSESELSHIRGTSHGSILQKQQSTSVTGDQSLYNTRNGIKVHTRTVANSIEKDNSFPFASSVRTPEDSAFPPGSISYHMFSHAQDLQDPRGFPFVAAERNSYFRRASAITVHDIVPRSLLSLLECARSILFAAGQLYQTLEQYVLQIADGRSVSMFKKVLDPSNMHMLHLIRSLDLFDDVSQKSIPSPAVCRGLVESSRDTISTLRKAVGLLISQIDMNGTDDARYVRWLVLELYAITAELSSAWEIMTPNIETLKPFLYGSSFSNHSLLSSISSTQSDRSLPSVRLRAMESSSFGVGTSRARTARRHAGSFSSKDVEIGKELPSYDLVPNMAGGLATHTPTLRTPKRQVTLPAMTTSTPSSSSFPYNAGPYSNNNGHHFRHASQSSMLGSSSSIYSIVPASSPAFNTGTISAEVLQTTQRAIDIAPLVWDGIGDALKDTMGSSKENRATLDNALDNARSATKKLSYHMLDASENYDIDMKVFREDVRSFLKAILHLTNLLKGQGLLLSLSTAVRSNTLKLSNHAEELAALHHISPNAGYTPRSTSPLSHSRIAFTVGSHLPKDNQLGSSLSRSRNVQPQEYFSPPYEAVQPGVAPLSIKSANKRKLQIARSASLDGGDMG